MLLPSSCRGCKIIYMQSALKYIEDTSLLLERIFNNVCLALKIKLVNAWRYIVIVISYTFFFATLTK